VKDNVKAGFEELADKLGEWDAGDDTELPPPRGWLLGNVFARNFISALFAEGGTGKTALRYAQLLSLATGNSLTGEHVFQRCRVLIVSLEDDANELRRRILAAMLHHRIDRGAVRGWLFLAAPGAAAGKLMTLDGKGRTQRGALADALETVVVDRRIDIISLDPFVKAHSVDENSNSAIDDVAQVLSDLAAKHDIAVDIPHHTRKGGADPGNAERGRGASATKDAGRLIYTLTVMTPEEAQAFGVTEEERRLYIRMDSAKVNIAPPMRQAKWFRLIGVSLGNTTERYPHGDTVQTVEPWVPPDTWPT
jgi:RecA-family ATPase